MDFVCSRCRQLSFYWVWTLGHDDNYILIADALKLKFLSYKDSYTRLLVAPLLTFEAFPPVPPRL